MLSLPSLMPLPQQGNNAGGHPSPLSGGGALERLISQGQLHLSYYRIQEQFYLEIQPR